MLPEARERGYKPGRFSFNVKGGRCEACQGDGMKRIEMNFLPDVFVPCDVCRGRRYNSETLQVRFDGVSIADLLESTVEDALGCSISSRRSARSCKLWWTWGWVICISASRPRRCRAARRSASSWRSELSRRQTGRTFYILDEPTTGLHFEDVRRLLDVLNQLVDLGNTVLVIEHQMDVIKCADWLIDLGPEGGERGGYVVAAGTPEQVVRNRRSHTARALEKVLRRGRNGARP